MNFSRKTVGKPLVIMVIILTTLLSMELAGQIGWKIQNGEWLFFKNNIQNEIFIEHPYLVAVPKPSVSVRSKDNYTFSHNSLGYRGKDVAIQKAANIKRVLTLGGSSTYCAGVSDNATWPYFLEEYLGKGWEVINLGVLGYTTVENLIQTALNISKLSPDIALYYEGWNDLRNMHINNLKSDYSDFHGTSLYYTLQLDKPTVGKNFTIVLYLQNLLMKLFTDETKREYRKVKPTAAAFTGEIDQDALFLYRRNLKSIMVLCNSLNIKPIMIPQVLNRYKLVADTSYGWIPFIRDQDLIPVLSVYNQSMREVASSEKAGFIGNVLEFNFLPSDFLDEGHFSPEGNKKFAKIVADYIQTKVRQGR